MRRRSFFGKLGAVMAAMVVPIKMLKDGLTEQSCTSQSVNIASMTTPQNIRFCARNCIDVVHGHDDLRFAIRNGLIRHYNGYHAIYVKGRAYFGKNHYIEDVVIIGHKGNLFIDRDGYTNMHYHLLLPSDDHDLVARHWREVSSE